MQGPGLILAILLAFIHAFVAKINVTTFMSQRRWSSFSGGVSLGYVFLDIFPELSHAQTELEQSQILLVGYLEKHVYILALIGLLVFYGLDAWVIKARNHNLSQNNIDQAGSTIFWIHISVFAGINAIFGYLLQDLSGHSLARCLLFFSAIALHFFIIDHHLREHHKALYDTKGRWLLTGAIMVGATVGQTTHLNEAAISIVWSFLAGSIIFTILNRELPDENQSCFWSFLGGAGLYAGLLLLI